MGDWKRQQRKLDLSLMLKKTKAMVQSRRPGKGRTWTAGDHKIETVRRFRYLGKVMNDTNDDTEEIRARILAANKAYSSMQTIFRFKEIH